MTRERRVEANARERQRVHTITAAFDTLQAAIPTEEKDVKLSKLSVIKIATAYIMALRGWLVTIILRINLRLLLMRSSHTALMSLRKSAESRKEMEVLNSS